MLIKQLKSYPAHFLRRIHQISTALFMHRCEEFDLTPVQFAALTAAKSYPDSDQSTVAGLIGYDRATIGKVLENLEKKGWIERLANPENRRTRLVRLTAKGADLISRAEPRIRMLNDELIAPLSKSEQQEFMRLLQKIVEAHNESSRAPVRNSP